MRRAIICLICAAVLAACAQERALVTSPEGNIIGPAPDLQAQSLGKGALGGPAPGATASETAARKAYYRGPRGNEWD